MLLAVAAGIAWFGAIIHFIAPLLSLDWLNFLHAPRAAVEAARHGDNTVYYLGMLIGALMALAGAYAWSAACGGRKVPLTVPALYVLSVLCIVRGLGVLLLLIWKNIAYQQAAFDYVASVIWLMAGLGFVAGLIHLCLLQRRVFRAGVGGILTLNRS